VVTTAPFLREILDLPEVIEGRYDSTFLETWMADDTREAV
jgi:hypothetical protein